MAKTTNEKIEGIDIQMQQLENRKKQLLQQQKAQDRKARTKRLIERGAILESLIHDAVMLTNDEIKAILATALPPKAAVRDTAFPQEQQSTETFEMEDAARD